MMKKFLLTVTVSFLAVTSAYAAEEVDKYPSINEIPYLLAEELRRGGLSIEDYISEVLSPLRRAAEDGVNLTSDDVKRITSNTEKLQNQEALQDNIKYDLNLDGAITPEELDKFFEDKKLSLSPREGRRSLHDYEENSIGEKNKIMQLDKDKDGKISLREMATTSENYSRRPNNQSERYKRLLALDPNQDGSLSATELEELARKAYVTVDIDKNGVLSKEETEGLKERLKKERDAQHKALLFQEKVENCKLPKIDASETLAMAKVFRGRDVSRISIADHSEITNLVELEIAAGSKKLYVVASAFKPVIWQITGATERISHLVLAGPSIDKGTSNNDSGNGPINAGAIGITDNKITFVRARHCGFQEAGISEAGPSEKGKADLNALLQREVEIFGGSYAPSALRLEEDGIKSIKVDMGAMSISERKSFVKNYLENLNSMKVEDVVSDASAVAYTVSPGWSGIIELARDGALIPLDGSIDAFGPPEVSKGKKSPETFKVVKDIPYFPAGLYEGDLPTFVMGKGIKLPANHSGYFEVLTEEEYRIRTQ